MRTSKSSGGRVEGKVAIVTGSGAGIGRVVAQVLADEGASVAVADIDGPAAGETVRLIEDAGGQALAVEVDISDEAAVETMVATTVERFGAVHVLHNNAALTSPAHLARDLTVTELDVEVWDRTFAVNVRGAALACKHVIPHMVDAGGGSIINTSSVGSLVGDLRLVAYGASKAALNTFTRYVATSHGRFGIRCNAIAAGAIVTDTYRSQPVKAGHRQITEASNLAPRPGSPEDIAAAVVFLASDESAFLTGEVLRVDGGILAHMPTYAQHRAAAEGG